MSYLSNLYCGESGKVDFDCVSLSIASPEKVRAMSYGAITKPETINYRTLNPEKDGLFCARIFGPIKNYECLCGKYKRIKYKGVICEKCKVEVISSRVRRERMGHIDLAAPVAHIWFVKSLPSRIGNLLDITLKDLESVIYFESYIVVDPGMTTLKANQILSEDSYQAALNEFGEGSFEAEMGAEAIRKILANLDLKSLNKKLRAQLAKSNSELKKKQMIKRLRIVENFLCSNNKPEHMILTVLPVMPPDFRPLVMLDGGRFATSDITELYRRLIYRNNRLLRLMKLGAPSIMIRNEKRMLQESVDAIIDNGRRTKVVKGSNNRPFKSLTDVLKGKQGRFRMHLLGKRVDYSARSVIVVGPHLRLHQCGIPKKILLELFKPFIYSKLEIYGIASTLQIAKRMVEEERPEVIKCLQEVIKGKVILLNRAPTLHRLGIQAFEPLMIEGKAIQLHPLVCSAYNADFDGDQMAVHVPLSFEAQAEARMLMLSSHNILNPANGKTVIVPTKDMVLGIHYLSLINEYVKNDSEFIFANLDEIEQCLDQKVLHLHTPIKFRVFEEDEDELEGSGGRHVYYDTTPGRVKLFVILPKHRKIKFTLVNRILNNKNLVELFDFIYITCGRSETVHFADKLMDLGFHYATLSGISFNIKDMVVPESKWDYVNQSKEAVKKIDNQYQEGFFTVDERYNKTLNVWSKCISNVEREMNMVMSGDQKVDNPEDEGMQYLNSIYAMVRSGARGSAAQLKQLCGMRGLMTKPSGEVIETPIIANFAEGLSVLEYFISAHGARKGIADTALKTANSGYLTRRLVDVAQDFVVQEQDCCSEDFIILKDAMESGEVIYPLHKIAIGYVTAEDLKDDNGECFLKKNELIDEVAAQKIAINQIKTIRARSVMTCKVENGTCAMCYGRDLATGRLVNVGMAVGIIAAQSIGEPGTQLTMRTFHVGGATTGNIQDSHIDASFAGKIVFQNSISLIINRSGQKIVTGRNFAISIVDKKGIEKENVAIPYGAAILVEENTMIESGTQLASWDPYTTPIIAECTGVVQYSDLIENVSYSKVTDEVSGSESLLIQDWRRRTKADLHPAVSIVDKGGMVIKSAKGYNAKYLLPIKATLNVHDKKPIHAGDIIAFVSERSTNVKDITGGLPRVSELFEARKAKNSSIISAIDGIIEFGKDYRLKRSIIVRSVEENVQSVEYLVPKGGYIAVNEGDRVRKGDALMNGTPNPHDILKVLGIKALMNYMIDEIQAVYRMQGVEICNKHIEVIVRQMLKKVKITDPGDTIYMVGEIIDLQDYKQINELLEKKKKKKIIAETILYGITKSSLNTKSFISAASFQETTKVLTEAAIVGKIDHLVGIKENVLLGNKLIPSGTGFFVNKWKKEGKTRKIDFSGMIFDDSDKQVLDSKETAAKDG